MKTLLAIDFDKWAARTYAVNFPDTEVRCASVIDELCRLPDADVYLGGPPCQPHSTAGKREASQDKRDCGPDFVAALALKKPRMFLMENVPGLMSSEDGKYATRLMRAMQEAGYVVDVKLLDAVNFGVPQFRLRCWWWGIRRDLFVAGLRHRWPVATHTWPPPDEPCMFGAALSPGVTVGQALGINGRISRNKPGPGWPLVESDTKHPSMTVVGGSARCHSGGAMYLVQGITVVGAGRNDLGTSQAERDITHEPSTTISTKSTGSTPRVVGATMPSLLASDETLDRPCPTVSAGSHTGGPEPINNRIRAGFRRRLTPLECLRLQSGPNDFAWPEKINKSAMYRVIGNGWACRMGEVFAAALSAADPDARTVVDLFSGGGLGAVGWHGRAWRYEP